MRVVGRTSRGVTAIKFKFDGDYVIGAALINNDPQWIADNMLVTVTENGQGKRCSFDCFSRMKRPNTGVYCHDVEKAGAPVAGIAIATAEEDLVMITASGIIKRIRVEDIRVISATKSKGVRVMNVADDTRIVSLAVAGQEAKDLPEEELREDIPDVDEDEFDKLINISEDADIAPVETEDGDIE